MILITYIWLTHFCQAARWKSILACDLDGILRNAALCRQSSRPVADVTTDPPHRWGCSSLFILIIFISIARTVMIFIIITKVIIIIIHHHRHLQHLTADPFLMARLRAGRVKINNVLKTTHFLTKWWNSASTSVHLEVILDTLGYF